MTPRASFVIPVHNGERWLSMSVLSALNQSIKQIEVIIVNDGSTDGSKDIIEFYKLKDKRVVPVHLEKNVGRSAARNIGNEKAQSPYILVLDADDMACRNRVKDTLAAFELKKADVVYGGFYFMDSLGNVGQKAEAAPFNPEMALQRKLNYICHSTMAYRKNLTLNVRYDEGDYSRLGLDDWKFQWESYNRGYKFIPAKNALSYYRVTEDSISSTRSGEEVEKAKEAFLATVR